MLRSPIIIIVPGWEIRLDMKMWCLIILLGLVGAAIADDVGTRRDTFSAVTANPMALHASFNPLSPVTSNGQVLSSALSATPPQQHQSDLTDSALSGKTQRLASRPTATAIDDAPSSAIGDAPSSAIDDAPSSAIGDAPSSAIDDAPSSAIGEAPSSAIDDTTSSTISDAPSSAIGDAPSLATDDAPSSATVINVNPAVASETTNETTLYSNHSDNTVFNQNSTDLISNTRSHHAIHSTQSTFDISVSQPSPSLEESETLPSPMTSMSAVAPQNIAMLSSSAYITSSSLSPSFEDVATSISTSTTDHTESSVVSTSNTAVLDIHIGQETIRSSSVSPTVDSISGTSVTTTATEQSTVPASSLDVSFSPTSAANGSPSSATNAIEDSSHYVDTSFNSSTSTNGLQSSMGSSLDYTQSTLLSSTEPVNVIHSSFIHTSLSVYESHQRSSTEDVPTLATTEEGASYTDRVDSVNIGHSQTMTPHSIESVLTTSPTLISSSASSSLQSSWSQSFSLNPESNTEDDSDVTVISVISSEPTSTIDITPTMGFMSTSKTPEYVTQVLSSPISHAFRSATPIDSNLSQISSAAFEIVSSPSSQVVQLATSLAVPIMHSVAFDPQANATTVETPDRSTTVITTPIAPLKVVITFDGDCEILKDAQVVRFDFARNVIYRLSELMNVSMLQLEIGPLSCNPMMLVVELLYGARNSNEYYRDAVINMTIILDNGNETLTYTAVGVEVLGLESNDGIGHMGTEYGIVDFIILSAASLLFAFMLVLGVVLIGRECYRRKRSRASFTLKEAPKDSLKMADFTLLKIPRPRMIYNGSNDHSPNKDRIMHASPVTPSQHSMAHSNHGNGVPVPERQGRQEHLSNRDIRVRLSDHIDGLVVGITAYGNPATPDYSPDVSTEDLTNGLSGDGSLGYRNDSQSTRLLKNVHGDSGNGTVNPSYVTDVDIPVYAEVDGELELML